VRAVYFENQGDHARPLVAFPLGCFKPVPPNRGAAAP